MWSFGSVLKQHELSFPARATVTEEERLHSCSHSTCFILYQLPSLRRNTVNSNDLLAYKMHVHPVPALVVPQAPIRSPHVSRLSTRIYPLKRETGRQHSVGRLGLHPVESRLDGVPSTLFTFRKRPLPYPTPVNNRDDGSCQEYDNIGGRESVVSDVHPLQAGLIEESDLQDVVSLLIKVRPPSLNLLVTRHIAHILSGKRTH